ncbi:MAG: LTA synthase family protein [Deltaproteobacteria bacterium]
MSLLEDFNNTKKKKNNITAVIIFAALCLILTFSIEFVHRQDFADTFSWCFSAPQIFITNFILVFSLTLVLYSVFGCIYISSSISYAVLLLISLASYYKQKFYGNPLFPWELITEKERINIFPLVIKDTGLIVIFIIIIASLLIIFSKPFLPKLKLGYFSRASAGLIALLILLTISHFNIVVLDNFLVNAGMSDIGWVPDENYKKNGMALSFLRNMKKTIIVKPSDYTEKKVLAVMNEWSTDDNVQITKNPNIIFVMNEAFWDPTLLSSVSFSADPIPTFRKLQKDYTSGWLLSPQYGGLTANIEFEVLTGLSTSFLPQGSVPYQQFIKEPILSLASILKEQGYYTAAVHSYFGWFWNRNSVYKNMGFDSFISSEGMQRAKKKGFYISDSEVSKEIIAQIKNSDKPAFIYAITAQNHGAYEQKRYDTNEIKVTGDISDKFKNILETYAQGLKDADESLKMLVDYLDDFEEPTMVIFFGDHLPGLGYDLYQETGYLSLKNHKWTLEAFKKMRSVPVVIWSNFQQKKQTINNMSDSFLGLFVLKMAGKELPPYFKCVDHVYSILPGFLNELKIDSDGNLYNGDDKKYKELMDKYWLIEYDRLFGKKLQEKY